MAIIIRYVKQDVDAEELVNESFVRIFRKLESFNMDIDAENLEKSFRAWIGRIAANISIDFLRVKNKCILLRIWLKGICIRRRFNWKAA
ncbi:hypothetical protein KUH03_37515 [Sphingobacterium sp. E70]|uniref:sigma factor n=1 Tax=Sphingobacterium sp. E70 TaxID=2853439 RepID=UPI00211C0546|nr:sigma factor [Sphingobacterium sp. E70]ULT24585.1 hypothetical protein KUH03_37515 [Sphingobacterium sp. E70]